MIIKRADKEMDRREWVSGFLGYRNRVTGRLSGVNWERLVVGLGKSETCGFNSRLKTARRINVEV